MRGSAGVTITVGLLVAAMIVGSLVIAFPTAGGNSPTLALKAGPRPYAGSSPKTSVLEAATGTWCPPCSYADPAISRIADEYPSDKLIVLMWHVAWGRSDPWDTATTNARVNWYGINNNGVPAVVVDGGGTYDAGNPSKLWAIGAYTNKGTNYQMYRGLTDQAIASGSSLTISLDGDLTATTANVVATITATDPITLGNLQLRFVLYEDSLYYAGSNGEPYHRGVVRDMQSQPITINQGETKMVAYSFTLSSYTPALTRNKLGVAVFVQTDTRTSFTYPGGSTAYDAEILQAARLDFVKPGIVVYRDETIADYTEPYERLLSSANKHFKTWDDLVTGAGGDTGAIDVRGMPDPAALATSPMVVWYTNGATSGVVTAADQTLLEGQLANGNGALLMDGEGLGVAIGSTAFYSNVLKSSFGSDSSTVTTMAGLPGDPISGMWATGGLIVGGGSPDVIGAAGNGVVTFQYDGGTNGAMVRSDYDANSRVVYTANLYFEGGDTNRQAVLSSVTRWLDGNVGPAVSVGYPNGGETLMPGTAYKLTWDARDVEIPANGVDIYFTSDSNNPVWTLIAANEPNDGVYWWNPPAGVDSPLCRLRVVARDATANTGEDISDADFTIGSPNIMDFVITLQPGLNLVSFPVTPIGNTVTTVLQTIDPNYRDVWTYDTSTGGWRTWHRDAPSNSLTALDLKMGFWVQVTSSTPVTLTIRGVPPTSTSIALVPGWNLVGFPSGRTDLTAASVKAATGATSVAGLGPDAPSYTRTLGDSETLLAGHGYWIYMPRAATWVVPYN